MEVKRSQNLQKNRFLKLSLKKNKLERQQEKNRHSQSSDLIIIDESIDSLRSELVTSRTQQIYSPIVLDDSSEVSQHQLPVVHIINDTIPSKIGNVSFNGSNNDDPESRPSNGGWSPAQGIICATPKQKTIPSTPKDEANESLKECSLKKIQQSQKKLLSELYGDGWKSIPNVFKTNSINSKQDNFNGITKKLNFNDDEDSDKENNIRKYIKENKELYLTGSDAKRKVRIDDSLTEKRSKKKLYTEKVPSTPDPIKSKVMRDKREINTTTKKLKGKSITEMVEIMKDKFNVNDLAKRIEKVKVTTVTADIKRLSFIGSLADNVPSWRCNYEAYQYIDDYKTNKEKLTRRLFIEFNQNVFSDQLDADMAITWDSKLRSTAGTTTNRLIKNSKGERLRMSSIKLSTKVLDGPQRLRDTLIHELCHAATWVIDEELRAGHGPLWKKWATRALKAFPELGEISRCHDMEIHFKYSYKCTKCGYTIKRHSKSLDITKKCCGYCHGTFEIILNKKNKDGVVVSTPARQKGVNDFAAYVKENYANMKDGSKTHAQVMKLLGEQFSERKKTKNFS